MLVIRLKFYDLRYPKISFEIFSIHIWLILLLKADMKSFIPLETVAIFYLANLFLKQGISSEYVMVDFILHGLTRAAMSENRELQNEKFLPIAGLELTTPESQV